MLLTVVRHADPAVTWRRTTVRMPAAAESAYRQDPCAGRTRCAAIEQIGIKRIRIIGQALCVFRGIVGTRYD